MSGKNVNALLLMIIVIAIWLGNLWAMPFFHERIIDTISAGGAKAVYAIDMDGDSDIDILSANADDNRINWYENTGYNSFITHVVSNSAEDVQSVCAADFDGDSLIDIVSANRGNNTVVWYENNGNKTFTPHTMSGFASGASCVYVADMDNNGLPDVIAALTGSDDIMWYQNKGNKIFTNYTIYGSAEAVKSVFPADINTDNHMDIVSANFGSDYTRYYINSGPPNYYFTDETINDDEKSPMCVFAIDMNKNDTVDVIAAVSGENKVKWYENLGNGNFISHYVSDAAPYPISVFAIDIDEDGDIDVISGNHAANQVVVYENDGALNFTPVIITSNALEVCGVFAIDIDGDSDIDILSVSYKDNKIAWYENDKVFSHPPLITSKPETQATEDQPYSYTVVATDIDTGETVTIQTGTLPDKMTFANNTISWTPENRHVGKHIITIIAQDSNGDTTMQEFVLTVINSNDAPEITSNAPILAMEDNLYTYPVQVSEIDVGDSITMRLITAPSGMTIIADYTLSWLPNNDDVGDTIVSIEVKDKAGSTDMQTYALKVVNSNDIPVISSTPPLTALEDAPYVYNVIVSDSDPGDNVTLALVAPPAGMTISDTVLSWLPTNDDVKTHTITIKAIDNFGGTATQEYLLTVTNVNDAPVISSTPTTVAIVDDPYSYAVTANDVDVGDSLIYSLEGFPAGMTITGSLISWTPTGLQLGPHDVVVSVKDKSQASAIQKFTITVHDTTIKFVSVQSPNSGEKWVVGSQQNITWIAKGGIDSVKIEYSINNGVDWIAITKNMSNAGIYPWTIPNTASTACKVRISDVEQAEISDSSDGTFAIIEKASITVTAPQGGIFLVGDTTDITWESNGYIGNIIIELSIDNGVSWVVIDTNVPDSGIYLWEIPNIISPACKIKTRSAIPNGPFDITDTSFKIEQKPSLEITFPTDSTKWITGENQYISWNSHGAIDSVKIGLSVDFCSTWIPLTGTIPNEGIYSIIVPVAKSDSCKIKITAASDSTIFTISDSSFSIIDLIIPVKYKPRIPMKSGLIGMGPNPIRSNLTINFGLAKQGDVRIDIYSLRGESIYRFQNRGMQPGYHKIVWNRTSRTGQRISNGTYLMRIQIKDLVYKKLVTVIR